MYASIINWLLEPVYTELSFEKSTGQALQKDLMPGNELIAGGSSSLGKASASPTVDSTLDTGIDGIDPSIKMTKRHPPINNFGSSAGKNIVDIQNDDNEISANSEFDSLTPSHVANNTSFEDCPFSNPTFPEVTVCAIGGDGNDTSSNNPDTDVGEVIKQSVICCSEVDFPQQSLISMIEDDDQEEALQSDLLDLANHVNAIVSVERNAEHQMYLLQDLRGSYHCTVPTISLPSIKSSWPSQSSPIPFLHIPSSSNYASLDNQIVVINKDESLPPFENGSMLTPISKRPLETLSRLMRQMFLAGVSNYFDYDNKKRSSTSKAKAKPKPSAPKTKRGKRRRSVSSAATKNKKDSQKNTTRKTSVTNKDDCSQKHVLKSNINGCTQREVQVDPNALPVITLGWTTQDCNRYGSNLATVAGNIKPFMRDGNLPKEVKKIIVEIVESVL